MTMNFKVYETQIEWTDFSGSNWISPSERVSRKKKKLRRRHKESKKTLEEEFFDRKQT